MDSLQPASLLLSPEGIPFSAAYGDVYHTAAGALAQAHHVFLAGNGLPQRWHTTKRFVIIETGFGLGNNFLATWAAWRADPPADGCLHFISVEKHPFPAADLAAAHALSAAPAVLSAELIAHWPALTPGAHRLALDEGRVILTLLFGEAATLLGELTEQADAIFLDGFAPAKNPQMWCAPVFQALAACAGPTTTLATWSVSALVRQGLAEAGFAVRKAPGFGGKRDMLCGQYAAMPSVPTPPI